MAIDVPAGAWGSAPSSTHNSSWQYLFISYKSRTYDPISLRSYWTDCSLSFHQSFPVSFSFLSGLLSDSKVIIRSIYKHQKFHSITPKRQKRSGEFLVNGRFDSNRLKEGNSGLWSQVLQRETRLEERNDEHTLLGHICLWSKIHKVRNNKVNKSERVQSENGNPHQRDPPLPLTATCRYCIIYDQTLPLCAECTNTNTTEYKRPIPAHISRV